MILLRAALLAAALAGSLALDGFDSVRFSYGTASVTNAADGTQHVVIRDNRGTVIADSYCDAQSGRYDAIVRFALALQAAVRSRDKHAAVSLMRYPLRINTSGPRGIETTYLDGPGRFSDFSSVFSPPVLRKIETMDPHDVFCRDGMSMLAGGTIWAAADAHGAVRGAVVNR